MYNFKRLVLLVSGCSLATWMFAQGLTTTATKDDWEEINFEFNSAVLSDGYPSLLRLADLLNKNPDYRVTLEGNTDWIGSERYNDKLSKARAETVKAFLVKYGARPEQITAMAHGKEKPEANNRTKEGRFINRRVTMTVRDGQGRVVGAGGVGDAIRAMQETAKKQEECCSEILKRLDKLDDILAAVKDLKAENDKLKQDVAALQQAQSGLQKDIAGLPRPPERAELSQMMEQTANNAIEKAKPSRFALLGLNIGPVLTDTLRGEFFNGDPFSGLGRDFRRMSKGNLTFTGKARYFAPFGKTEMHALQAEGEYMYYRDRQEGQFDIGLVNRRNAFQAGLFSSIKHVNLRDFGGGGTLGQAALTADYLFSRGRAGFFGTKSYLSNRVISRTPYNGLNTLFTENYLSVVDQVGASAQIGVWDDAYFEGNVGALFRKSGTNRPGGTIKLVQPFAPNWAFTVEASLNETFISAKNTGRLVFGVQFGNWLRPKEFTQVRYPVPADIPRVRYEVLTRFVRTGNTPPVADAGPDLTGVPAGTITLNGSGSYDPEGEQLTYRWDQINGPNVSITGQNTAIATFTAAAGTTYTFRLTVKDPEGAQSTARVNVSTLSSAAPQIVRFTANPTTLQAGQTTTLVWQVLGADTVQISNLGQVDPKAGTSTVSPQQTTTYQLTATNRNGSVNEAVTVTVQQAQARILSFSANPTSITAGQSANLCWSTQDATSVSIEGIGGVAVNGCVSVSPTQTTNYTLTASNQFGQTTASTSLSVAPGGAPRVVKFSAAPVDILANEKATLVWQVENATTVTISGIGNVSPSGTQDVTPTANTTYTLTASNQFGQVISTASVNVTPATTITSFTANPATVQPGNPVTLTCLAQNANQVTISGAGPVSSAGTVVVNPTQTTTYTCTATGTRSQATAQVTVNVGGPGGQGLICDAGPSQTVSGYLATLNAYGSKDLGGNNPLTYSWRVSGQKLATIQSPNAPITQVALQQSFGEYIFELTVTNSVGARCTTTTRVNYIDP